MMHLLRRARAVACAGAACLFACAASAQEAAPQAGANEALRDYLDAMNSGSRAKMNAFIGKHYDPAFLKRFPSGMEEVAVTANLAPYYESAGLGYEVRGLNGPGAEQAGIVLVNRFTGGCAKVRIPFAGGRQVNGTVTVEPAACPADVAKPPKLTDRDIVERLKQVMEKMSADGEFSGAVLLARDGKPLFRQAYGMASKAYGAPNRIDTKFNIASVGKMFTAVAVAQLAERGKLSFDEPIGKRLPPGWLDPEAAGRIQIRHLLTHTSGLGDYFDRLYASPSPAVFRGLADYRALTAGLTPGFTPGTRQSYSNTGYLLLGVIVEQASGETYESYVRKNIFDAAGMKDTDDVDKDVPVPNRATGYTKVRLGAELGWQSNEATRVMKGGPSGGMFSNVDDLLRFDAALRGCKLLSAEYTKLVLSPKPELQAANMGYGFYLSKTEAGWVASHSGDSTGINAQYRSYLDAGYTLVVLANYGRPAASIVDSVVQQLIARR